MIARKTRGADRRSTQPPHSIPVGKDERHVVYFLNCHVPFIGLHLEYIQAGLGVDVRVRLRRRGKHQLCRYRDNNRSSDGENMMNTHRRLPLVVLLRPVKRHASSDRRRRAQRPVMAYNFALKTRLFGLRWLGSERPRWLLSGLGPTQIRPEPLSANQ